MVKTIAFSLLITIAPMAYADSGSFTNSGGSASGGSGVSISGSTVTSPVAGTLSMDCPGTSSTTCAGGNINFAGSDGSSVTGSFTSGKFAETCSGGGRGGHISCSYSFTGYFSGTWTANGGSQAIVGATYQSFPAAGYAGTVQGTTGFNSAYTPFYFTDGNARILRSDDLSGTNAIAYGTQGSGVGQFYGPSGIALDASGRIYITDTYNDRIVRIDDMNGTNWTSFGTYGSGVGQFAVPQSISIDPTGHIWVLDNGNGRLIRMDDMNGANWTTVGTTGGSGVGQFAGLSSAPGFDSLGRIYLADSGNGWIVRFDDLNFTNWTTTPPLGAVTGVVVDAGGKIYAADSTPPSVIRVDDMTGANRTSVSLGTFSANTIAIDSTGMVLLADGYNAQIDDSQAAVLTSNIDGVVLVNGVYATVYGAVPISLPSPRPSAVSFTPATLSISQNVGSTSPAQPITVYNFGGSPLTISNISVSGAGFAETNTCIGTLAAGSTCTIDVTFTPSGAGTFNGTLTITDTSGNSGPSQTLTLTGTGTAPAATVSPTSLNFGSEIVGTSSSAKSVTLTNSGTGPMNVTNISITGPFSQTNNCASLAAGASCSILVTFTPTALGAASGTLSITDDVGTQTVALSGTGVGPLNLSPSSLEFNSVVGTTSAPQTVTATNNGTASITISSVTISGSGFAISSNTCIATLSVGASCAVSVTFAPTVIGDATGALTFTDDAIGSPQAVQIQGTATGSVTLSTSSLSFGTVTAGSTSSAQTVTLTNHQSVAVNFTSIVTTANFHVASNTCGSSLAARASCTVGVTFSPTLVGNYSGTLTFTDDAPNNPQLVTLSGSGGGTPVTLSTSSLSFGTVKIGQTSSPKSVTLTNHQNVSLSFTSIATTAGFAISSNTCGSSIVAGANCMVAVTFKPTVKGTITGSLTFTDSAANSPQKVTLSGSGK